MKHTDYKNIIEAAQKLTGSKAPSDQHPAALSIYCDRPGRQARTGPGRQRPPLVRRPAEFIAEKGGESDMKKLSWGGDWY